MTKEFDRVLTLRNKRGELIGVWVHENQNVHFYKCEKAGLDEMKDLEIENEQEEEK